jgi:hypothetical protein
MTQDSETVAALRRAGTRVVYHLLRAGVEALKAVEAVVDELARVGKGEEESEEGPSRIEVE